MDIFHRFELIFQSPAGSLLLFLFLALCLLSIVYAALRWKKKKEDYLSLLHEKHYQEVDEYISYEFLKVGHPRKEFFGRQEILMSRDRSSFTLALAPTPDMISQGALEKFSTYLQALGEHEKISYLSSYRSVQISAPFLACQDALVNSRGELYSNLYMYCKDHRISSADVELLLLELAGLLSSLHTLSLPEGKSAFHGTLLASHIFLQTDELQRIKGFYLAHHGLAYSLGLQSIAKKYLDLMALETCPAYMDLRSFQEHRLFYHCFAPEIFLENTDCIDTQSTDFYSFASLAVYLFTGKDFISKEQVSWEQVPSHWQNFLKLCLSQEAQERPKNFAHIQDFLYQADYRLTKSDLKEAENPVAETKVHPSSFKGDEYELEDLAKMLKNTQERMWNEEAEQEKLSPVYMKEVWLAIEGKKWDRAEKILHFLEKEGKHEHADWMLAMAIVFHEKGLFEKSQEFYQKAQDLDPRARKRFRDYMTS